MNATIKAVEPTEEASDGEEEAQTPLTGVHSFAEKIGSRNLMIAIVTMPLFFIGLLVLIISVVGMPEEEEAAAVNPVLESLGATSAAPPPISAPVIEEPQILAESAPAAIDGLADAIAIPEGASIGGMALDGDRLAVRIETADGPVIIIYDLAQNTVVQTIPFNRQ